jgi:hypothetical protein
MEIMRLLVIALAACGSRTSIEAPEPPRMAAAIAPRVAPIELPPPPPTEITGLVMSVSGDSIEGVLVELLVDGAPFENTTSDGMGQYVLAVPPGPYRMQFRYDDWLSEHDIVAIEGERTWANSMVVERRFTEVTTEVTISEDLVRNHPIAPRVFIPTESRSVHCGGSSTNNTYYVEGISNEGTTWTIPVEGRTFEGVLGAAVGSQGDDLGVTFSSSTLVENTYIVDEGIAEPYVVDIAVETEGVTEPATIENL